LIRNIEYRIEISKDALKKFNPTKNNPNSQKPGGIYKKPKILSRLLVTRLGVLRDESSKKSPKGTIANIEKNAIAPSNNINKNKKPK
jgi:hypothetical protein